MTELIYIKLLDEGLDVWRPAYAQHISDNRYLILGEPFNKIPAGEKWEFEPGTLVVAETKTLEGRLQKVATGKMQNKV